jgi:hypothetical protein
MSTYAGERILRKNSGAGIGYGKKSDFTKSLASSPDSSHYNLKAVFDINKEKRKGCTIGTSREVPIFQCRKRYSTPISTRENLKIQASQDITLRQRLVCVQAGRLRIACAIGHAYMIKHALSNHRMPILAHRTMRIIQKCRKPSTAATSHGSATPTANPNASSIQVLPALLRQPSTRTRRLRQLHQSFQCGQVRNVQPSRRHLCQV